MFLHEFHGGEVKGTRFGIRARGEKSSGSFSVGWFGKKPRASHNVEQQMNKKGNPEGSNATHSVDSGGGMEREPLTVCSHTCHQHTLLNI